MSEILNFRAYEQLVDRLGKGTSQQEHQDLLSLKKAVSEISSFIHPLCISDFDIRVQRSKKDRKREMEETEYSMQANKIMSIYASIINFLCTEHKIDPVYTGDIDSSWEIAEFYGELCNEIIKNR